MVLSKLNWSKSWLATLILTIFTGLIFALLILAFLLITTTTQPSISGMLAQRNKRISYYAALVITGISFSTTAFVACDELSASDPELTWSNAAAILSPIFSFGILVFPIVVHGDKLFENLGEAGHANLHYSMIVSGIVCGAFSTAVRLWHKTAWIDLDQHLAMSFAFSIAGCLLFLAFGASRSLGCSRRTQ